MNMSHVKREYKIGIIVLFTFYLCVYSLVNQYRYSTKSNIRFTRLENSHDPLTCNTSHISNSYNDYKVYMKDHVAQEKNNVTQFMLKNSILGHPLKLRIISNSWNLCRHNKGADLDVLLSVYTRTDSFDRRQLIRNTWANRTLLPTLNVAFIVGIHLDPKVNLKIIEENEKYGDLIQGDFIDSYRNLTYKGITLWRWVKYNCFNAPYVGKTDDDNYTNTPRLLYYLRSKKLFNPPRPSFSCSVFTTMPPIRDKNNKYYMSLEEWPHEFFAPYCSGVGLIMTGDLPSLLYDLSFEAKMLWVDDANYGMVALRDKSIKFLDEPKFYLYAKPWNFSNITTMDWVFFYLVIIEDSVAAYERLWNITLEHAQRTKLIAEFES
jgi:hypothetical protein